MKIEFLEDQGAIKIYDHQKQSNQLLKLVFVLNSFVGILNLWKADYSELTWLNWTWIGLTFTNILILALFTFKKSSRTVIPLNQIVGYRERNYWGQQVLSLVLKNGKKRDLNWHGSKEEAKNLFHQLNIKPL